MFPSGVKKSRSNTMLGMVHMCANCRLITVEITALQMNLMGWNGGGRASSGKCSVLWAAVMVVPDCRSALPSFPPFTPSFPVPRRPQPICSCLASRALHQVGPSY